jgi:hypothetical protein
MTDEPSRHTTPESEALRVRISHETAEVLVGLRAGTESNISDAIVKLGVSKRELADTVVDHIIHNPNDQQIREAIFKLGLTDSMILDAARRAEKLLPDSTIRDNRRLTDIVRDSLGLTKPELQGSLEDQLQAIYLLIVKFLELVGLKSSSSVFWARFFVESLRRFSTAAQTAQETLQAIAKITQFFRR